MQEKMRVVHLEGLPEYATDSSMWTPEMRIIPSDALRTDESGSI
jgi:hypothetical protein